MSSLIGQSLGRYHILEQLGEGGMATVYKAYDTRLERDVAIKIIRRGAFPPDQLEHMLKRFEREAKSLAKLSHPNIVKVHDFGEHEGAPFLVMEYLPGGTLKQYLGKPSPWQSAVQLLIPVAQALEYAHEHNIIHRDIKPSNILLTEKGQPMLTDFGIAKILDLQGGETLTATGTGIGTPEYMSPEQGMGKPVSASTDIYSLGVVFFELITGRKPYIADTPMAVVVKHLSDPLPRPTQFVRNIPESVEKILLKALAKKPEYRYQNMSEFIVTLGKLLPNASHTDFLPIPRTNRVPPTADTLATMEQSTTSFQQKTIDQENLNAVYVNGIGQMASSDRHETQNSGQIDNIWRTLALTITNNLVGIGQFYVNRNFARKWLYLVGFLMMLTGYALGLLDIDYQSFGRDFIKDNHATNLGHFGLTIYIISWIDILRQVFTKTRTGELIKQGAPSGKLFWMPMIFNLIGVGQFYVNKDKTRKWFYLVGFLVMLAGYAMGPLDIDFQSIRKDFMDDDLALALFIIGSIIYVVSWVDTLYQCHITRKNWKKESEIQIERKSDD